MIRPDLLEDAVGEAPEGEHIHIQDALRAARQDKILLRLHRILLRHDHEIITVRERAK